MDYDVSKISIFRTRIYYSEIQPLTVLDTAEGVNHIDIFCLGRKEVSEWGTKYCNVKNVKKLDS